MSYKNPRFSQLNFCASKCLMQILCSLATQVARREEAVSDPLQEQNGSDVSTVNDKGHCMLVSRVASLGRLRHKPQGYSGPLSRSLLAYHSLVSNLQTGIRDLLEMTMIAMFLDGNVERGRNDWMDLSLRWVGSVVFVLQYLLTHSLPFHETFSCSLGIATLNYLDNLEEHGDPTAKATQQRTLEQAQRWIQHSDFELSLKDAFHLWDAVSIVKCYQIIY